MIFRKLGVGATDLRSVNNYKRACDYNYASTGRWGARNRDPVFAGGRRQSLALYLYREDGKVLRQRTNDNSGQNVAPIFDPIGETIVLRARSRIRRPSIGQSSRGDGLKKLDVAPSWYLETKTSPHFTNVDSEAESPATAECVTGTNRLA